MKHCMCACNPSSEHHRPGHMKASPQSQSQSHRKKYRKEEDGKFWHKHAIHIDESSHRAGCIEYPSTHKVYFSTTHALRCIPLPQGPNTANNPQNGRGATPRAHKAGGTSKDGGMKGSECHKGAAEGSMSSHRHR